MYLSLANHIHKRDRGVHGGVGRGAYILVGNCSLSSSRQLPETLENAKPSHRRLGRFEWVAYDITVQYVSNEIEKVHHMLTVSNTGSTPKAN